MPEEEVLHLRAMIGWQPEWADEHWPELDEVADIAADIQGDMLRGMYDILDSIIDGRGRKEAV